jgi:hypothetical protein
MTFSTGFHQIIAALDSRRIPYLVGGSFASSHHGIPRATNDADLLADLQPDQIAGLVTTLKPDFYVDEDSVKESVRLGRPCNVIHMATVYKYDFFLANTKFHFAQLDRAINVTFDFMGEPVTCRIANAEDIILAKLEWYLRDGRTSERQLTDIANVLAVSGERLDYVYLRDWSARLGVADLLEQALNEPDL